MAQRRGFLILAGLALGVYGLRALPWSRYFGKLPPFEPLPDLAPFRMVRLEGGISAASSVLMGIDTPDRDAGARRARAEAVRANLCLALFRQKPEPGVVPITYFSEFRCPYCRVLEGELSKVFAANPGTIRLVQHELPIFGPASEYAARASVAAARQGKQQELRQRLMRSPLIPDPMLIGRLATEVGLDAQRLMTDMADPSVGAELDTTRALADVFGFAGTPGLVIGRTVLNGATDAATIALILAQERREPLLPC